MVEKDVSSRVLGFFLASLIVNVSFSLVDDLVQGEALASAEGSACTDAHNIPCKKGICTVMYEVFFPLLH